MERENQIKRIFIISIIILAVLIITLIGFLIAKSSNNSNENEFASEMANLDNKTEVADASTQIGKSVEESQNTEKDNENKTFEAADIIEKTDNKPTTSESSENKTEAKNETQKNNSETKNKQENKEETTDEKEEKIEFDAPIKGEIIREFAKDSLVFSNTLQEWITHNAVDIKADKTSVIKSAATGTVYAIKNDPRYGLTVIINHDNGYQTIYSNLLTSEFVVKGEKVEKGQSLGTVGNTASFEISDDYHLHFELLKDNEYLDPTLYMNFN